MKHSLTIILLFDIILLGLFHSWSSKGQVAADSITNIDTASRKEPDLSSGQCSETFTDLQGTIVLTVDDVQTVCEAYISGPNGSVVEMTISAPNVADITFEINDQWYEAEADNIYSYTGGDIKSQTINSFSSQVLLTLEGNETFQVEISYAIQERENLTTSLTNNSGLIEAKGNSDEFVNFQHTWFISAGEDNFIYFYLQNVTLDDSAGDFLAIGTGSEVFADSPALMISGIWTDYPTIHLNGTEAYVSLFMKTYSPNLGVALYYDSWLYTPPTLFPKPTKPPTIFLSATFKFDDDTDDYRDVVANFTESFMKVAINYCSQETIDNDKVPHYDLTLDVVVAEVVENKPCLVVEFYVNITNGTCLKDISFSEDDYKWLMGNFSNDLNNDFGREVMSECPMELLWILAVVLVAVVALLIIVFVGFKSADINFKGMAAIPSDDIIEEELISSPDYTMTETDPEVLPPPGNHYEEGTQTQKTDDYDVDSMKREGVYESRWWQNSVLPDEPFTDNRKSMDFQMSDFTPKSPYGRNESRYGPESYFDPNGDKKPLQESSIMKATEDEGHCNFGYESDQGSQSTERSADNGIYDSGHASTSSRNDNEGEYHINGSERGTGFAMKGLIIDESLQPLSTPESGRQLSLYEVVHPSSAIYEEFKQKDDTSSNNSNQSFH